MRRAAGQKDIAGMGFAYFSRGGMGGAGIREMWGKDYGIGPLGFTGRPSYSQ